MAKTPEEMLASMIANLKEKTGKSLDEWVAIAKKTKLAKHGEIVSHLKSEYEMGHEINAESLTDLAQWLDDKVRSPIILV